MDVTRLIATIKHKCGVELETEEVFMNTRYKDFIKLTISRRRGSDASSFQFSSIKLDINGTLSPLLNLQLLLLDLFIIIIITITIILSQSLLSLSSSSSPSQSLSIR